MKNNNVGYGAIVAMTLGLFLLGAAPQIFALVSQTASSSTGQNSTQDMAAVIEAQGQLNGTPNTNATANVAASADEAQSLTSQIITLVAKQNAPSKSSTKVSTPASGSALPALVYARQAALLNLAKINPGLFLSSVMPAATRNALPQVLQPAAEQSNTVTGTLRVFHADDFTNEANDIWDYYVDTPAGTVELYPTSELSAVSGTHVTINGYSLANVVVAQNDQTHITLAATPPLESVGVQHVLVLLLQYPGAGAQPFTPQQAHDYVFNGQFEKYYEEQSYGKISFVGDVTNWIPVTETAYNFCYGGGGQLPTLNDSDIQNYISQNNIDISKYNRVVYMMDHPIIGGGCSDVGETNNTINGKTYRYSQSWIGGLPDYSNLSSFEPFEWNYLDEVLSHETGHALGLMHSNGWDCGDQTLYGDCQHIEYGNYFDVMGYNGYYAADFVALYKNILGWLDPNQVLTITKSGDYSVKALELPNSDSTKANNVVLAEINNPVTGNPYLAIDHRIGIGFDSALNSTTTFANLVSNEFGIFVGTIQPGSPQTEQLLNMNPTQNWYWNPTQATLNSGKTFTDPDNGITLTTDPVTSTSAPGPDNVSFHVQLSAPQCVRHEPLIGNMYAPVFVNLNGQLNLSFFLTNEDSPACNDMEAFTYSISGLPPGATSVPQPAASAVTSGNSSYQDSVINIPSSYTGSYLRLTIHAAESKSTLTADQSFNVNVLPPLTITNVVPSAGQAGNQIVINGTGFIPNNNTYAQFSGVAGYQSRILRSNDGTTLNFTVPASLISNCATYLCPSINTVPGSYIINLSNTGASVSIPFTVLDDGASTTSSGVPTVSVSSTPTLTIAYDASGKESVLTNTFDIAVSAGSSDQKILKDNAFYIYDTTASGLQASGIESYSQSGATDLGGYWGIAANTTAHFEVSMMVSPKTMFAGAYYGILTQVQLGDNSPPTYIRMSSPNTTNTLAVIGELSPYINQISPTPVASNALLTITGINFSKTAAETVALSRQTTTTVAAPVNFSVKSTNGTTLTFVPAVSPGTYVVQVIDSVTGASNTTNVTVSVPPTTAPNASPIATPSGFATPTPSPLTSPAPSVAPTLVCPAGYTSNGHICVVITTNASTSTPTSTTSTSPSPTPSVSPSASPSGSSSPAPQSFTDAGGTSIIASVFYAIGNFFNLVTSR